MKYEKIWIKKCFWLIIILLPFLMIPNILPGIETDKTLKQNSISQGEYVLVVKGDHISLKAEDASLKDILEEIGSRMKIDVVANIPKEQKITITLDMICLEDALKRFKANYAYVTKSEIDGGKITRIVVVPKGGDNAILPSKFEDIPQPPIKEYNPQPPIQEYNPQPSIQEYEHKPQPTTVKPEIESQMSSILNKNTPQTPDTESENTPQTPDTESENTPQTPDTESENTPQTPDTGSEYNPQPSMQ